MKYSILYLHSPTVQLSGDPLIQDSLNGGEVVGEDCGDNDGHDSVPAPPKEKGRGSPFVLFFLDLLPSWEKVFPSGPWPPWRGRGESPSEIGSASLSLSVSAFPDSTLSPFLIFPEIRNSDWAEILTRSLSGY